MKRIDLHMQVSGTLRAHDLPHDQAWSHGFPLTGSQIVCSLIPVVLELVLGFPAPKPPYAHIHHLAPPGHDCLVGHTSCRGVVRLDRAFRLGTTHVDQGLKMRYHLSCCYAESSQFIFGCRRHDKLDDLGYRENSTVEARVRVIF